MLKSQIGWTVEVYVDDLLVKCKETAQHLTGLREAFTVQYHYKMKLNPMKCMFDVGSCKFLGFVVAKRGTKASLKKIKVIMSMKPPKNLNGMQRLAQRVCV